jgi:hypothetical protein
VQVLVALAVGLVFWEIAWTFGIKALDAFLVTIALVVAAITARIVSPWVREYLRP